MMEIPLITAAAAVVAVFVLTSFIITTFLRSVDAGEILLASRGRHLRIYRGPCKALIVPVITQVRRIPAQAINVDIEITDQTADIDAGGRPAPVKVTVRASAIVSVGEDEAMVNTAANKFFSKLPAEQLSTLTDVLSSAGRRAINLLWHDQLFNARNPTAAGHRVDRARHHQYVDRAGRRRKYQRRARQARRG
jgi:flotillin